MGRNRTIIVSTKKLLVAIATQIRDDVAEVDEQADAQGCWSSDLRLQRNHAQWPLQDLARWAGRRLTDSERLRHQQAIQRLEHDGLIRRQTRFVTLTSRGWQRSGVEPPPPDPPSLADEIRVRRQRADAERMAAKRRADRDLKPGPVPAVVAEQAGSTAR